MQVGDLIKFVCSRQSRHNKTALYLGEDFIHRDDGVVIENHKVLMVGESTPTIIDKGLLRWITVIK